GQMQHIAGDGNVADPVNADGDGGEATNAEFVSPHHLFAEADGSLLFTEDVGYTQSSGPGYQYTMRVRRIDWASGIVSKVAGDEQIGVGGEAVQPLQSSFAYPEKAFVTPDGGADILDSGNDRLRRIDPESGLVTTLAGRPNNGSPVLGDGLSATVATLDWPRSVAVNPVNGALYIADAQSVRIRRVDPATGVISTIVGNGPPCVRAGVAWHVECEDDSIPPDTVPGTEMPLEVNGGTGLAASSDGLLAFVDQIEGAVWVYNDGADAAHLFSGSAHPLTVQPGWAQRLVGGGSTAVPATGSEDALSASLKWPAGLAFTPTNELVFTEQDANRIDILDVNSGQVSILAGAPYTIPYCVGPLPFIGWVQSPDRDTYLDGPAALAHFFQPIGLSVASDGSVYVADTGNNRIRKIDRTQRVVTTVAGNGNQGFQGDGLPALAGELVFPTDVTAAPDGSLLITDWGNERIRRVDSSGVMRTFAGSGLSRVNNACGSTVPCGHYTGDGGAATSATFNFPYDGANFQALGPDGRLYVADTLNNRIRAVQLLPAPSANTPEAPLLLLLPVTGAFVVCVETLHRRRRRFGS
ncbi:MAG: hypothetical protein ABR498_04385, partial [Candidatus Dormibacteria bacterium]